MVMCFLFFQMSVFFFLGIVRRSLSRIIASRKGGIEMNSSKAPGLCPNISTTEFRFCFQLWSTKVAELFRAYIDGSRA